MDGVELYFEHKSSGGGPIESLNFEGDLAIVVFEKISGTTIKFVSSLYVIPAFCVFIFLLFIDSYCFVYCDILYHEKISNAVATVYVVKEWVGEDLWQVNFKYLECLSKLRQVFFILNQITKYDGCTQKC